MLGLVTAVGALAMIGVPAQGQAPKRGGILNSMIIEDPPGFSIHESATVSTVWPMMPCSSNLVLFDQLKAHETVETVVPELAERWSWQEHFTQWPYVKNLVPHHSLYNWGRMQEVWLDK